ncbi:hypothetical protein GS504_01115 [Rhodococcus hoagii]|nr:hypothetical protein [Prescottella equi]
MSSASKDVSESDDEAGSKLFVMRVPRDLAEQITAYMYETQQTNQSKVWRNAMTEMLARSRRRSSRPPADRVNS